MGHEPRGAPWWVWLIAIVVIGPSVLGIGCCGVFAVIGQASPETSVYAANRVPSSYVREMRELGALAPDERPSWFYSSGLMGIDPFFVATERHMATYDSTQDPPLLIVTWDQIRDVELYRGESWIDDSELVVYPHAGPPISVALSIEKDGDVRVLDHIEGHITAD